MMRPAEKPDPFGLLHDAMGVACTELLAVSSTAAVTQADTEDGQQPVDPVQENDRILSRKSLTSRPSLRAQPSGIVRERSGTDVPHITSRNCAAVTHTLQLFIPEQPSYVAQDHSTYARQYLGLAGNEAHIDSPDAESPQTEDRANQEGYSPTSPHITFAVPEGDLPVTPMAIGAAALSISGDSPRLADVAEYRLAASLGATYSIAPAYRESAAGNKTFGKPGTLQIGQLGNILDHFVAAESPGPLIRPRQLQVHMYHDVPRNGSLSNSEVSYITKSQKLRDSEGQLSTNISPEPSGSWSGNKGPSLSRGTSHAGTARDGHLSRSQSSLQAQGQTQVQGQGQGQSVLQPLPPAAARATDRYPSPATARAAAVQHSARTSAAGDAAGPAPSVSFSGSSMASTQPRGSGAGTGTLDGSGSPMRLPPRPRATSSIDPTTTSPLKTLANQSQSGSLCQLGSIVRRTNPGTDSASSVSFVPATTTNNGGSEQGGSHAVGSGVSEGVLGQEGASKAVPQLMQDLPGPGSASQQGRQGTGQGSATGTPPRPRPAGAAAPSLAGIAAVLALPPPAAPPAASNQLPALSHAALARDRSPSPFNRSAVFRQSADTASQHGTSIDGRIGTSTARFTSPSRATSAIQSEASHAINGVAGVSTDTVALPGLRLSGIGTPQTQEAQGVDDSNSRDGTPQRSNTVVSAADTSPLPSHRAPRPPLPRGSPAPDAAPSPQPTSRHVSPAPAQRYGVSASIDMGSTAAGPVGIGTSRSRHASPMALRRSCAASTSLIRSRDPSPIQARSSANGAEPAALGATNTSRSASPAARCGMTSLTADPSAPPTPPRLRRAASRDASGSGAGATAPGAAGVPCAAPFVPVEQLGPLRSSSASWAPHLSAREVAAAEAAAAALQEDWICGRGGNSSGSFLPALGNTSRHGSRAVSRHTSRSPSPTQGHASVDTLVPVVPGLRRGLERELHNAAHEIRDGPAWKPSGSHPTHSHHAPGVLTSATDMLVNMTDHERRVMRDTVIKNPTQMPHLSQGTLFISRGYEFDVVTGE